MRYSVVKNLGLLVLAVMGTASGSYAGTIYLVPPGLAPGDQYQLVFVTSDTFDATSSDISTYNAEVSAEAALNPALSAFDALNGVTWTVIGSTATVNANVNASSSGSVYTLDGVMVASSTQSLYSDQCSESINLCPGPGLFSPIDITQWGTTLIDSVWTGSSSGGVAQGNPSLGYAWTYLGATLAAGGDPWGDVSQGCSTATSNYWADCDYNSSSDLFSLYALSSVITVEEQPAPTPEPGAFGFLAIGMVGLVASRCRKANRSSVPR